MSSWKPLAERTAALPLILAGPILRRTEPDAVTVWLALKEPCTVTLCIYEPGTKQETSRRFAGSRQTIRLGDHLHLVAVTARPAAAETSISWGRLYYYNLFFQVGDSTQPADLFAPGILLQDPASAGELQRLVYQGHPLPSFVLPPANLNLLRIVHGSCRKPHGIGKEMLSALDVMIAETVDTPQFRPQQLFLTGDQVYGDDVAAALLFMLIDAGNYLFTGNQKEKLPLIGTTADTLAPEARTQAVREKAMFTTTSPQNHLLSLSEYAAMYLFAWSYVLWPDELPDIEDIWTHRPEASPHVKQADESTFSSHVKCLNTFRATLPQVRRALANTPTYMIGDDHDVTDDWYLDGAWCQRVIASPLGKRIIRNALLAMAMFQAWGNTPDQFETPPGQAFLHALDRWHGEEEDACIQQLNKAIDLPHHFGGYGELPHHEQALHWHYTFSGPTYQIIVMDTRTHRLYREPEAFPGLLAPDAMRHQVQANQRDDVLATIIISPAPVLGVEVIESIQFWSHMRFKDNYTYDREAWALEWGTFQHLLRVVSSMKRVVFLSGDVHYAFGSSLNYWDYLTNSSAKIIDFTSSSLHNEGSNLSMALLSVGYPYVSRLLGRTVMPSADFFAWDMFSHRRQVFKTLLNIIGSRMFYRFWWAIPQLIKARRSREEIVLPAHGWSKNAFHSYPPNRSYRMNYLRNILYPITPPPLVLDGLQRMRIRATRWFSRGVRGVLRGITLLQTRLWIGRSRLTIKTLAPDQFPRPGTRHLVRGAIEGSYRLEQELEEKRNSLIEEMTKHEEWLQKWKAGGYIVGYANIGDIRFRWTDKEKSVVQYLWWQYPDNQVKPMITTEYRETLELPSFNEAPRLP